MSQIVTSQRFRSNLNRGFGQYDPSEDPSTYFGNSTPSSSGSASSIDLAATYGPNWSSVMGNVSGGAGTPGYTAPTSQSSNTSFWNNLAGMFNAAVGRGSILASRYSVPQLAPGQLIQQTPYGTTMYQAPTGATGLPSLSSLTSGSIAGVSTGTLLLIGAGLLAFMMFEKK